MRNFLTIRTPLARQRSLISWIAAGLLLIAAVTGVRAAGQGKAEKVFDYDIVPLPSLLTFAAANKIPVSGIGVPDPMLPPKPGDRVTYAIALHDQSGLREWLIDLSEVELSAAHRAAPPPGTRTVYSAIGGRYPIASAWAEENVRIAGPFYDKDSRQDGTPRTAHDLRGNSPIDCRIAKKSRNLPDPQASGGKSSHCGLSPAICA
jgi:hypothetical protein